MPMDYSCPLAIALAAYKAAFSHAAFFEHDTRNEHQAMIRIAIESAKVALRHLESLTLNPPASAGEDASS